MEEKDSLSKQSNGVKQLPFDPNISHPLKYSWTLWYDAQLSGGKRPGGAWGENIKQVFSFSTVEDFWRMYNNLTPPSALQQGSTYSLFKDGIEPKWEDPANEKGGKWTAIIQKQKGVLDRLWLWLMLACIGQVLEEEGMENICGAVVNVRRGQDKLCVWTRDADQKETTIKIGLAVKKALELQEGFPLGYQPFAQPTKSKGPQGNKYDI